MLTNCQLQQLPVMFWLVPTIFKAVVLDLQAASGLLSEHGNQQSPESRADFVLQRTQGVVKCI